MKAYSHFSLEILDEWKSHGFSLFQTHILESSNPYKAIVEIRPFKWSKESWMTDSISSIELMEFALNDSPMVDYVVNEHFINYLQ